MYKLIARNESGASICVNGNSINDVMRKFDSEYYRSGFMIEIVNEYDETIKIVRKTTRM